ncbi:hypothetical protein AA18889_2472 [Acetobacter senegalensis DSM 18889]|nr:hypothetical protein AA18889_2472 [Acetobacter senegalensis DSM 18889]
MTETQTENRAYITLKMLRKWGACQDGKSWFSDKFPQGAEYGDVISALYADKRYDDARWLARNVFDKAFSSEIVVSDVNAVIALTADAEADSDNSGDSAQIGSSGDGARIGSSGNYVRIGSSGDSAQIGSSGYGAQIGSSGKYAQIGSSGYGAQIGSSGKYAQIGSSGDSARIEATGENAVVACSGRFAKVKLGKGGNACLNWHDGKRVRFVPLYEGEDGIKAGVWYELNSSGSPVEVEAA